MDRFPTSNTLSRRSLLRTGAAATAAMMLGLRPWAPAPAAASGSHLVRSSYTGLLRRRFAVGSAELRLRSISDVAGAALDASLEESDDAFVLTFSGPLEQPLASATHTLHHPELGTFELFTSPITRPSAGCMYEAVIDRSVST